MSLSPHSPNRSREPSESTIRDHLQQIIGAAQAGDEQCRELIRKDLASTIQCILLTKSYGPLERMY